MEPWGLKAILLCGLHPILVAADSWNEPNMIDSDMLKSTSYEDIIQYNIAHPHSNVWEKRRREKRQAIKGTSRKTDVTLTNKDDIFHGPEVEVPDISFRDMASFVNEAQKTIEDRFENLEREIYKSRARQVCGPYPTCHIPLLPGFNFQSRFSGARLSRMVHGSINKDKGCGEKHLPGCPCQRGGHKISGSEISADQVSL